MDLKKTKNRYIFDLRCILRSDNTVCGQDHAWDKRENTWRDSSLPQVMKMMQKKSKITRKIAEGILVQTSLIWSDSDKANSNSSLLTSNVMCLEAGWVLLASKTEKFYARKGSVERNASSKIFQSLMVEFLHDRLSLWNKLWFTFFFFLHFFFFYYFCKQEMRSCNKIRVINHSDRNGIGFSKYMMILIDAVIEFALESWCDFWVKYSLLIIK